MPKKLKKPCKHPQCPKLTHDRFCDDHKDLYKRDTPTQRGYDSRWQKARLVFLRANPLCESCLKIGRVTKATVVDHVTPHRGDDTLFWDQNNWQALCKRCHDTKTMTTDRYQVYKY